LGSKLYKLLGRCLARRRLM